MPTVYPNHRIDNYFRWTQYIHRERNSVPINRETWDFVIKQFNEMCEGLSDSTYIHMSSVISRRIKAGERTHDLYNKINYILNGRKEEQLRG